MKIKEFINLKHEDAYGKLVTVVHTGGITTGVVVTPLQAWDHWALRSLKLSCRTFFEMTIDETTEETIEFFMISSIDFVVDPFLYSGTTLEKDTPDVKISCKVSVGDLWKNPEEYRYKKISFNYIGRDLSYYYLNSGGGMLYLKDIALGNILGISEFGINGDITVHVNAEDSLRDRKICFSSLSDAEKFDLFKGAKIKINYTDGSTASGCFNAYNLKSDSLSIGYCGGYLVNNKTIEFVEFIDIPEDPSSGEISQKEIGSINNLNGYDFSSSDTTILGEGLDNPILSYDIPKDQISFDYETYTPTGRSSYSSDPQPINFPFVDTSSISKGMWEDDFNCYKERIAAALGISKEYTNPWEADIKWFEYTKDFSELVDLYTSFDMETSTFSSTVDSIFSMEDLEKAIKLIEGAKYPKMSIPEIDTSKTRFLLNPWWYYSDYIYNSPHCSIDERYLITNEGDFQMQAIVKNETKELNIQIPWPGATEGNVKVQTDSKTRKILVTLPVPFGRDDDFEVEREYPVLDRYNLDNTQVTVSAGIVTIVTSVDEGIVKDVFPAK